MLQSDTRPDAAKPPEKPSPGIAVSRHDGLEQHDPNLVSLIRRDGTIYAHELCRVCGIKPNTLRMSRLRGKGPKAKRISNNRVVISLRDAAAWLQATGRYTAALRLAEWLDQQWREAEREHRSIELPKLNLALRSVSI